ncbi:hypothetical protein FRC04_007046 [Tulasnella sp. 424]|nr:hypothetical protein FRC04_007046 [Tulasnella sp. 424]
MPRREGSATRTGSPSIKRALNTSTSTKPPPSSLTPQVRLSSTVTHITYGDSGTSVRLETGDELKAKYALVTFSVSVSQHPEDVKFEPALYGWKREDIDTMKMGTYIKGVLKNMYPGKDIPRPKNMHFNRWLNDKLTRGAFSGWPASFYVEHQDNLRAPIKTLYFAGEHTSFEFYGIVFPLSPLTLPFVDYLTRLSSRLS